jgi:hypothetical protein
MHCPQPGRHHRLRDRWVNSQQEAVCNRPHTQYEPLDQQYDKIILTTYKNGAHPVAVACQRPLQRKPLVGG